MSHLKTDFIERCFLAVAGIGSLVLVAASIFSVVLAS
jgi:hypothetical protein